MRKEEKTGLLGRPIAAMCACAALLLLSAATLLRSQGAAAKDGNLYTVEIKHYGLDEREIERSITAPLEDALYALPGAREVFSVSDNSRARVSVVFSNKKDAGRYESVSAAAQRFYETLPSSAQRPEIMREDGNDAPFWVAAVGADNADAKNTAVFLERTIKPALQSIEGVARVEIGGAGLTEIHILLDNEKCAALGLSADAVARALAENDALFPAGSVQLDGAKFPVSFDGRYASTGDLETALIPLPQGGFTPLGALAEVVEAEREPDVLSRLNGKKTAVISVTAAGGANIGVLSKRIAEKVKAAGAADFEGLVDKGKEENDAYLSVLKAALSGALTVAVLAFLLTREHGGKRRGGGLHRAVCASLSVPFICVLSLALLGGVYGAGGKTLFAGLAAGIGVAVDATLIVSEKLKKYGRETLKGARDALKSLLPPLFAGAATTIAALLPLIGMENAEDGIKTIALSLGAVTIVSFFTSVLLLPPIFLAQAPVNHKKLHFSPLSLRKFPIITTILTVITPILQKIRRRVDRFFAFLVILSVKRVSAVITACVLLTLMAGISLFFANSGASSGSENPSSENSVYVNAEFDASLHKEEVDRRLSDWALRIKSYPGVKYVETGATKGHGTIFLMPENHKTRAADIRRIVQSAEIEGGFLYIEEPAKGERNWTITVTGDENEKCREIARALAQKTAGIPIITDAVLNFKDGAERRILQPERERIAAVSRMSFSTIEAAQRNAVHAPVVYKRLSALGGDAAKGEVDVRLRFQKNDEPSLKDALNLTLAENEAKAADFVSVKTDQELSGVRREDRRRTASITVRTRSMQAGKARSLIMPHFDGIDLPENYAVTFDKKAIEAEAALAKTLFYFVMALFFCFIVIAMANESYRLALLVLLSVPPSMALPCLALFLSNSAINATAASAFIAVSGITVNAAILTVDALRNIGRFSPFNAYRALRKRRSVLLATSGTTILSALPFIFLLETSNAAIRSLALITALGTLGSCFASLTLVPAFFAKLRSKGLDDKVKLLYNKENETWKSY